MRPHLTMRTVRGLDAAAWEWPGDGPPLLFAHATGFHGRIWDDVIRRLPGRRAIAVEFRGHGRSGKPDPPYCWSDFGRDLAEWAAQLDLRGAVGVGHSMGGHAVAHCAALRPETFASLVLVDPVIFAPEMYGRARRGHADFVAKRRNEWTSADEMFDRFAGRPPFCDWRVEVLRDYCDYGLLPSGDRFVLACPPRVEASIYAASSAPDANLHPLFERVTQPVKVVRGGIPWDMDKFDLAASPTDPGLASRFPSGRDVVLEGRSHYIPMETPGVIAELL